MCGRTSGRRGLPLRGKSDCALLPLSGTLDDEGIRKAVIEVGPLRALWHFGGEYDKTPDGKIVLKGQEHCLAEMLGLIEIGYRGYAGFELCHPLPKVNGVTVGIDFVDKNAQLAAEYMRGIRAEAIKQLSACWDGKTVFGHGFTPILIARETCGSVKIRVQ